MTAITLTTAQQQVLDAFRALPIADQYPLSFMMMYEAASSMKAGDPMSYARSREIHIACLLGHTVAKTFSGADAYEADGTPVEYKSTTQKTIRGGYTGISVQPTWEEQEAYLVDDKIGPYPRHYFARYDGWEIAEIWVMDSDTLLSLMLPKAEKRYYANRQKVKADPRLAVTISATEIRKHGTQVL
jgi:hypothetical protein